MLFVDLLGWWYSRGWEWALRRVFVEQTHSIANFFSITDLLKTLFAPFRQDSINVRGAPIGVRLQVLGENIISRFLGLLIRLTLVMLGIIAIGLNIILASMAAILWPLLPLSPGIAVVLLVQGVGA